MEIGLGISEITKWLEKYNIIVPEWVLLLIALHIVFSVIGVYKGIYWIIKSLAFLKSFRYTNETKLFIEARQNFTKHLMSEVERLNREADWNDFYYTELEAEVEVQLNHIDDDSRGWFRYWHVFRLFFVRPSTQPKI